MTVVVHCTYSTVRRVAPFFIIDRPFVISLIEPSMMAFADHNERDSRIDPRLVFRSVHLVAGGPQSWQFFFKHYLVLALPNTIAVDENVLWQRVAVHFFEVSQTRHEHFLKQIDHFLTPRVYAKIRRPLRQFLVSACHHGSNARSAVISRRRMSHVYADYHGFPLRDKAV